MILRKALTRGAQRGHHDQNNGVEIEASIVFPTSEETNPKLSQKEWSQSDRQKAFYARDACVLKHFAKQRQSGLRVMVLSVMIKLVTSKTSLKQSRSRKTPKLEAVLP